MTAFWTNNNSIGGVAAGVLAIGAAGGIGYAAAEHPAQPDSVAQAASPAATATVTEHASTAQGHREGLKTILDQMVSEGKITQAQEDDILSRVRSHMAEHMKGRPGGDRHALGAIIGGESQAVADLFKITPAELRKSLEAGQSLHAIAQAHNVSDQALMDTMTKAFKDRLDKAVAAGKLTSDREQTMLTQFQTRLPQLINSTPSQFTGHGRGAPGAKPTASPAQ